MFTAVSRRCKSGVLFSAVLLGVAVMSSARGDVTDFCFNYLNAQDYSRAQSEALSLLQRDTLSREEQRGANMCLGQAYKSIGRARDALPVFQRVEELSRTTSELATAYLVLGAVYSNLSDLDKADLYDQRALRAYKELGDKGAQATTLNNWALVARARGDADRALTLYQQSLALEPSKAKKPAMLNNMAMIYSLRQEYPKAVKILRQAIDIYRNNGEANEAAVLQLNLGNTLRQQGKLKAAESELLAGLNTVRLLGDKRSEGTAYKYLGSLEASQDSYEKAIAWYEKAEAVYREIGDTASADVITNLLAGK